MKKKMVFALTCLFVMVTIQTKADTRAAILLLHNGTGTNYDVAQLPQAVSDAAEGDTLYLSAGLYQLTDTLVIDKPITMIGQGQNTIIGGVINIAIEGNPTLMAYMLDAMRFLNDVIVTKSLSGLKIRKINISAGGIKFTEYVESVLIDRCYIANFYSTEYLRSASIINSKIENERGQNANTTECDIVYKNCIIKESWNNGSYDPQNVATYINCIMCYAEYCYVVSQGKEYYTTSWIYNCSFINSLIWSHDALRGDYHSEENCYYQDGIAGWENENGCALTKEELLAAGYLGTDGTVVGIEGGSTPYTLTPNSINVENGQLNVDAANKVLNVTLKVKAN